MFIISGLIKRIENLESEIENYAKSKEAVLKQHDIDTMLVLSNLLEQNKVIMGDDIAVIRKKLMTIVDRIA